MRLVGYLGRRSTVLAEYMGWVRKLLLRLLPELLERNVIHWLGGYMRRVRKLFSRLLSEFLVREVVHRVDEIRTFA